MTTTSNGAEIIEGVVQSFNDRGVHLSGEEDWRNFSKFAADAIETPSAGARVRLSVDSKGFIRSLQILGAGPAAAASTSPDRDRQIRRMCAIKTAAQLVGAFAQTHEEVRTDHIFPIADRILAWLEKEDATD